MKPDEVTSGFAGSYCTSPEYSKR